MGPLRRIAPYVLGSVLIASCAPRLHDGTPLRGDRLSLDLRIRQLPGNSEVDGGSIEYFCWPVERDERVVATEIDFGDGTIDPSNVGGGYHRYESDGWHAVTCTAYGDGVWGKRAVQHRID